jgi:hypothetical protein
VAACVYLRSVQFLSMINSALYSREKIDGKLWDEFISNSPQRAIYAKSGYLDSICPGWSAIICKSGNDWVGVLPINIDRKYFQHYTLKPPWAQYLGIFFCEIKGRMHRLIYLKKTIIESIIAVIPYELKLFNHNFNPGFDYFIPFTWNDFEVRPLHSYTLSLENSVQEIYGNFSKGVKSSIARSIKLQLKCVENNPIDNLVEMMTARKIITARMGNRLRELWKYITANAMGFTIYITDPVSNQIYCGGAFVIEADRIILLASALDFRFKKTGAHTFMVWKGIEKAYQMGGIKIFDFEGSMIKNIEAYNRSFGANPIVYYNISRNRLSALYSFGLHVKEKMKAKEKQKNMELVMYAC